MKKTNRFIALLTALVLVFSTMINSVAFAAVNPDVVGTDFEVAVGKLKAVGVMEGYPDGSFKPEGEITRAEFAKIAVVAMGLGDAAEASKGVTKFGDVTASHWASGYINLAVNRGLVAGYPDGTYKPEGKLTNAEAVTILIRLVGLGPVVDKEGTWPANYIGRASNEGIFKGVNVASGANATRGLVAKMLSNTLEVQLWGASAYKNDGSVEYGKLWQADNVTKATLLSEKLNIDFKEEVVVDGIPQTDSGLENDEISIGGNTYVNKTDFTGVYLLGLKVNAWVNDDDELIFAEVKTNAGDIIFDEVASATDAATDKVELLVKDKEYDVKATATYVVNFDDTADITALAAEVAANTVYGKVVLDKGKVDYMVLFSFDGIDSGVVEKTDKAVVSYWDAAGSELELDFDDYDGDDEEVIVLGSKFETKTVADVKANSVIYTFEFDSEDLYVVVAGTTATGKLDRVREDDARVAGKDYNTSAYTTLSTDKNDTVIPYVHTSNSAKDLVGENVTAVLDINGELRHVSGEAEATSGVLYGLAVDAYANGKYNTVEIFNKEGKTVAYNFETKVDGAAVVTYFETNTDYLAVAYEINNDGQIEDATFESTPVGGGITNENVYATTDVEFDKDRDRMEVDDDANPVTVSLNYYFDSDTIFMKSQGDEKEALFTWEDVKGTTANISVVVVGNTDKAADFVWIYDDYSTLAEDDYYGIVTENAFYNGDDWIVTVDVMGVGTKELAYDDDSLKKGDILTFKISSANEIVDETVNDIDGGYTLIGDGVIDAKDGDFIDLAGTDLKLDSKVIVYQTKVGENTLDKAVSKTAIKVDAKIAVIQDAGIVKVVVVVK